MKAKQRAMASIFGGAAIVLVSILLTEDWYDDGDLIYNLTTQNLVLLDIPLRWPALAGFLIGLYGLFRLSLLPKDGTK